MKIFGFVPARMNSKRLYGKPLKQIKGRPMLEHVFERAKMFNKWNKLSIATCDKEIMKFAKLKKYKYVMTSKHHKRCLDRVFEAASKIKKIKKNDIIVCVQGDEPMLHPNMIRSVIKPLLKNKKIKSTVLSMHIVDYLQFKNPNIVKIIHDLEGKVLYTSRAPIPYCKKFTKKLYARRIYGIFAFRYNFLKFYSSLRPSPLEIYEACDSNRICDNGGGMYIAPYKYYPSFAVDTISDLKLVNKKIKKDPLIKKY